MDQLQFASDFIVRWEDGGSTNPDKTHSLDPVDNGNWTGGKQGVGVLVGSNHGVTPAALAAYRKVPVTSITRAVMRALTVTEAAQIALRNYYQTPRLDLLTWCRPTASIFDFGWGTGPGQAIKCLQRMLRAPVVDGVISPGGATARLYNNLLSIAGEDFVAGQWAATRNAFYDQIIASRPANAKYENGWKNRTAYFTPGHSEGWWTRFGS